MQLGVCFNSILVRLKDQHAEEETEKIIGFNSILVRLKVFSVPPPVCVPFPFQFHTGSIKRLSHWWPIIAVLQSFNSILVRLKEVPWMNSGTS